MKHTLVVLLVLGLSSCTAPLFAEDSAVAERGPWEARAIIGYHQAGAASADFSQNVFIDIYLVRFLGNHKYIWDSKWNTWGNVRIASTPRQLNTPLVNLLQGLVVGGSESPLNTNVNELALSAEFQTGIEYDIKTFNQGNNKRRIGLIGFFGATGTFEAPDKSIRIYVVPSPESPQYNLFKSRFPSAVDSTYIGFVNPDRDRFYRQYGMGFRLSKFNTKANYESPETFSFTVGQDEAITGGRFRSVVARFDAFYPLPIGDENGRWRFLYLFGTTTLRLSQAANTLPLVLESAPSNIQGYESSVAIVSSPSNRDTYRIGIGVDLVHLIKALPSPPK